MYFKTLKKIISYNTIFETSKYTDRNSYLHKC